MDTSPKWVLETKRGWGMLIAAVVMIVPFVNQYLGLGIDAAVVGTLGETVTKLIDAVAAVVATVLMIWGMWRPTAPLTLLPPK